MQIHLSFLICVLLTNSCKELKSNIPSITNKETDSTTSFVIIDSTKTQSIEFLSAKSKEFSRKYYFDGTKDYSYLDSSQFYCEKILDLDSTNFKALLQLEGIYIEKKKPEKAIFYGIKIWDKSPNAKYYHEFAIYQVYNKLNYKEEAKKALQRGINLIEDRKKEGTIEDVKLLLLEQFFNIENGSIELAYKKLLELERKYPENKEIKTLLNTAKSMLSKE